MESSKQQTAVDWLFEQIPAEWSSSKSAFDAYQKAIEMQKDQSDKVSEDWWDEAMREVSKNPRKYKSFEQYYNETFKS
jgi:hypothetical protein